MSIDNVVTNMIAFYFCLCFALVVTLIAVAYFIDLLYIFSLYYILQSRKKHLTLHMYFFVYFTNKPLNIFLMCTT